MGQVLFDGSWRPICDVKTLVDLCAPAEEAAGPDGATDESAAEPPEEES